MVENKGLIKEQIELEKDMTERSIENYQRELVKAKEEGTFGCTPVATKLLSRILEDYATLIDNYLTNFHKGKAIKSTIAAKAIRKLKAPELVAFVSAKIILNSLYTSMTIQSLYKAIGQGIEDEWKMQNFKEENKYYYESIQKDLNKRGAKANRKKNITTGVFNKRLEFHVDRWTITEKFQVGLVLLNLFEQSTHLIKFEMKLKRNKTYKIVVPTDELMGWVETMNEKLEVMQPLFLPMICQPKEWTSIFEGGYISPYLKRNRLVKNNDREYLKLLKTAPMPMVYDAVNHLQNTGWRINNQVLDVVKILWQEGRAVAELPDREDEPMIPYPYPDKNPELDSYTDEEKGIIKKWKSDTYAIHKRNVQKMSVRILVAQILRIAEQFKGYETIWFPYQLDFRGRLYPIPVLLQPQGSDLAKGLLIFSESKPIYNNQKAIEWFKIHGANMYGYDKESYTNRIRWVDEHTTDLKSYAENPLENRGWLEADKPFQFLAWCFEYYDYSNNPKEFQTHIPIQLDGTCNGLQHYSALLRDEKAGKTVNLIDSDKPSDIYAKVAERLEDKLNEIAKSDNTDKILAIEWLQLGINRKLTKRPVMVLPYGGTTLSCRQYIEEYLKDTYSPVMLWKHFDIGDNPTDCIFKSACWLAKYLWQSITETLKAAIVGMDYIKSVAKIVNTQNQYIEWLSPIGLLVRQGYKQVKKDRIETEMFGKAYITKVRIDIDKTIDHQKQLNGICPNFIHSLDASCLMLYLNKCKQQGIASFMTVHDCYGVLAPDTEISAKLLREAFCEIYSKPVLENWTEDVLALIDKNKYELPELPDFGSLDIQGIKESKYFFN